MQNKKKHSLILFKLKKYSSESKFKYIQHHSLNKSPTKNVPTFKTGSLRLLEPKLNYPDKFYQIPEFKPKRSASFGFGIKTNFAKKQFVEPSRYKINSSFELQKLQSISGPSFGISRQDFYKGKLVKTSDKVGPGIYNLNSAKKKASFNIGLKMKRNDQTPSPGPGAYNLRTKQSLTDSRLGDTFKLKGPRIKTEYFQKPLLQRFDNKVPGPGSYELSCSESWISLNKKTANKPRLPQCPRFKVRQEKIPSPGKQQFIFYFKLTIFVIRRLIRLFKCDNQLQKVQNQNQILFKLKRIQGNNSSTQNSRQIYLGTNPTYQTKKLIKYIQL